MTRGVPDTEFVKKFNKDLAEEFRANDGKVGGQFADADILLLNTIGAKSGQARLSPLAYFRIDGKLLIVGSFAGSDTNPAWVHNLRVNAQAHIEIGADAYNVIARELPTNERDEVFPKLAAVTPRFAEYQANTQRVIPVFELQRS